MKTVRTLIILVFLFGSYAHAADFSYTYLWQSAYPGPLNAGERTTLELQIRNTGDQVWYKYQMGQPVINLGTIPQDQSNPFYCGGLDGWVTDNRIALK